ncbi:putative monooxygenase [Delitschia confertaspora ATCC 74209]|uniref:Monooxygenase n=1 Tax=Delitschia confertaspora ATCC 74209 TaxID=1513339 RepID=A0A9P4JQE8_9PLEO|nr:putative monooxygenase [Delitschia confertaspora ATCC 74209]
MSSSAESTGSLSILIIGAGLCGLGSAISLSLAGHAVTVLEAVPELREVGAGLQITPNGTRLLRAWGLTDKLRSAASPPATFAMYRFDGTALARRAAYGDELERRHGSPLWCLHRADLQQALAARAIELGVSLRLGTSVARVEAGKGAIELHSGERLQADLVIAADGLWSAARAALFCQPGETVTQPLPTGDLAYRILVDIDNEIAREPELAAWLANPGINIWVGPSSHAVAYSIRGGRYINLVLLVPDNLPSHVAKAEGNLEEMRALFRGWDPVLIRLLQLTDKVEKWRLHYLPPLPRWTTPGAHFVAAGDCAHPMLPYMAQGANSSLEDAATLGALLSKVRRADQLSPALAMYDAIRRPRVDQLVRETFLQGEEHHLADGEEQKRRDEHLAKSMMDEYGPESETPWTHPKIQPWIYGYDAYAVAEAAFAASPF